MEKIVLMKRVDDEAPNPWYAEFQKLITERGKDSEVAKDSYSWMNAPAPADATDSDRAHAHVKAVADEFYRLRAKLSKGEGTETMDTEELIRKCGYVAEETLELKAAELRKREPSLSREQAPDA